MAKATYRKSPNSWTVCRVIQSFPLWKEDKSHQKTSSPEQIKSKKNTRTYQGEQLQHPRIWHSCSSSYGTMTLHCAGMHEYCGIFGGRAEYQNAPSLYS